LSDDVHGSTRAKRDSAGKAREYAITSNCDSTSYTVESHRGTIANIIEQSWVVEQIGSGARVYESSIWVFYNILGVGSNDFLDGGAIGIESWKRGLVEVEVFVE
jgi:hypothetical protein